MRVCVHVSVTGTDTASLSTCLDSLLENPIIDKVCCYQTDPSASFDLSHTKCSTSASITKLTDLNTTISSYDDGDDVWILVLNNTTVYPSSLLETYTHVITTSSQKYCYGLLGYMLENKDIANRTDLVHILDSELSACYHRSVFTERWKPYLAAIQSIPIKDLHIDIILANWFAFKQIYSAIIKTPSCNSDILKSLNPTYKSIPHSVFVSCITVFKKINLFLFKLSTYDNAQYAHKDILRYYNVNRPTVKYEHLALLLESRFDPSYELLLRQVIRFLPANFRIALMVTENVLQQWNQLLMKITGGVFHAGLIVFPLKHKLTSVQEYNEIMLDVEFWKKFTTYKKVLIFQTDTMMFQYGLEAYMKYDYIGSPWPINYGLAKEVGNGGFSLRTIQAMITCLEHKEKIKIPPYKNSEENLKTFSGKHPEDVFYSFGMPLFKYTVAPSNVASFFSNETVLFNHNLIGCHQLSKFNNKLYNKCLENSIIPYNHVLRVSVGTHRYGWVSVKNEFDRLFTNTNGVELRSYGDLDIEPSQAEWVGIFHLTPLSTKKYYSVCNIRNILNNPVFLQNLQYCKGVFTLSNYLTKVWKGIFAKLKLDIPVDTVYHPVGFDGEFDPAIIDTTKTVILVGSQLRRATTLYQLDLPGYRKVWLPGRTEQKANNLLHQECEEFNVTLTPEQMKSVDLLSNISNEAYDALINNSFLIVHQVNASANNAIIEAISRNIPIFCNRLEAAEEYLGKDYPLFFRDAKDLALVLQDKAAIHRAHAYLKAHQELKDRLTMDTFLSGILNSPITKRILTQTLPLFLNSVNELKLD
jgi:hypothetical protein